LLCYNFLVKEKGKIIFTPKTLFVTLIVLPFLLALISVVFSLGLFSFDHYQDDNTPISSHIELNDAKKVVKKGQELRVTYEDGSEKTYYVAKDFRLAESGLDMSKVAVRIENEASGTKTGNALLALVPIVIIGFPLIFWCMMLYHALVVNKKDKIVWILLILFFTLLGSIAYFFLIYRSSKEAKR
jgi:flagellar basal body-associated protein FliL